MKCEDCQYRFICFTLANLERPKRVKVNWKMQNTCGDCRNADFPTKMVGYRKTVRPAGYCSVAEMLVHKNSAICSDENFKPKKMSQVDKIYAEIRELLALKNGKTKLPRYCVDEE